MKLVWFNPYVLISENRFGMSGPRRKNRDNDLGNYGVQNSLNFVLSDYSEFECLSYTKTIFETFLL